MIRQATQDDVDKFFATRNLPKTEAHVPVYVASIGDAEMLFSVKANQYAAECHIVVPPEHVKLSRVLVLMGLEFVKFLGFDEVYTDFGTQHKTTRNMLLKLGFEQVECYNESIVFRRVL